MYTGNDGKVNLQIPSGSALYVSVNATIDNIYFSYNQSPASANDIPAEVELITP
jgi:hypothetical protein